MEKRVEAGSEIPVNERTDAPRKATGGLVVGWSGPGLRSWPPRPLFSSALGPRLEAGGPTAGCQLLPEVHHAWVLLTAPSPEYAHSVFLSHRGGRRRVPRALPSPGSPCLSSCGLPGQEGDRLAQGKSAKEVDGSQAEMQRGIVL